MINKRLIYDKDIWELAEWMHNTYEAIAKENGWQTQKKTKVPFKNLPIENKATMLELAKRLKER